MTSVADAAALPRRRRLAATTLALLVALVFAALGVWQLERRAWKLALIERVEGRVHAPPAQAPARADWPRVSAERDDYRRVRLRGRFVAGADTHVQAVTELGPGWWLMTPLRRDDDASLVLVNRGFVAQREVAAAPPAGVAEVTGLLRMSEPGGAFLRRNDPAVGRWTSRDVQAIAAARGLGPVAPYFVDAEAASPPSPGAPVGGLTVVQFRNPHLAYALTWFALSALALASLRLWWRAER